MADIHLTLIGKPGCHLCDDARNLVATVVQKVVAERPAPGIVVEERSILEDAELHDLYVEDIPVLLINGQVHNIDPLRLRTALLEAS